ncbi:MAG: hypothetical protein R3302_05920 [Sulfurimonadaceae bacterium]|nr:hypothetical protein [Sulfurimonadaceae bacterium]
MEIAEEKELALSIIDAIEDCNLQEAHLLRISSKLSYAADVINKNNDHELIEILPVIKRFSLLLFEYRDKILNDSSVSDLTCSFVQVVKGWFASYFLTSSQTYQTTNLRQSILADIATVEMVLGVCMLDHDESLIDDLFF